MIKWLARRTRSGIHISKGGHPTRFGGHMSSDSRRDCGQLGIDGGVLALHSEIIAVPRAPVHTDNTHA